jgi:hypothetical protein
MMMTRKPVLGWLAILAFAILSACSSLGVPPADTVAKRLAAGYVMVNTVADGASKLLATGRITPDEARRVHGGLQEAVAGLDAAGAIGATDPAAAQNRLQASITILTTLQAYLASKQGAAP